MFSRITIRTAMAMAAFAGIGAAVAPGGAIGNELGIPGTFSTNVSLATDYVYRGISQTDEEPAVQGGLDWEHETGLYLGIWASNIDLNDDDEAHVEIDYYGGWRPTYEGVTFDLGFIYYDYPGASNSLDYEFWELKAGASYDFQFMTAGASLNWSPSFFGDVDDAWYFLGDVTVPLPYKFELSGHIGHQWFDDNGKSGLPDYLDWSIGISRPIEGIFDIGLTYYDTDLKNSECNDICDARVVLAISRSF